MKIVAVCGAGIGTSVLLKMNAEKVLRTLGLEATVEAADIETARASRDA
ncbi:MAG: PTS ascorbate transporter subunit IIB, partial [Actinomycetales bacterium]|nr:PTS ascorbate transporter subunit IIB [Actinomycetales bacterium]